MTHHRKLDFKNPNDNIYATTKMLGHHGGDVSYAYYTGKVFAWDPVEKLVPILGMIGMGVNRLIFRDDGSIQQLGKELCYYTDLESDRIIDTWYNPYIDKDVEVMHVRNHLMNINWTDRIPSVKLGSHHDTEDEMNENVMGTPHKSLAGSPMILPWEIHGDLAIVSLDAMMKYPNILTRTEFPEEWSGDTVNANEHMCFFTSLRELQDTDCQSAHFTMVLTRMARFLPWMKMGTHHGRLYYRAHTWKLMNGRDDFPDYFLNHMEEHDPEFLDPPEIWTEERAVTSLEVYAHMKREQRAKEERVNIAN